MDLLKTDINFCNFNYVRSSWYRINTFNQNQIIIKIFEIQCKLGNTLPPFNWARYLDHLLKGITEQMGTLLVIKMKEK